MSESKSFYIETYGCQMNVSDSEIVASILVEKGYCLTQSESDADLILLNTCAIRDRAEQSIRKRLLYLQTLKKKKSDLLIGLLGCMAERLKTRLLEEEYLVDLVVGPDAYRSLPLLIEKSMSGQRSVNTLLSREETYADLSPVRLSSNGVSAFISIMRGCDNMCSFCVVPFTRGRERSRDPKSIAEEAKQLFERGYREITLLGQNVDSYSWTKSHPAKSRQKQAEKPLNFAALLAQVAEIHPLLRIRFSTSHPKDMSDEVLHTIRAYDNICKYIHLPVQSGSSQVLKRMNRGYDRKIYMQRIEAIRQILGETCAISTDIITGFCAETSTEHKETLTLMEEVKYDLAYMFAYSERPGTLAARQYEDDITEPMKKARLQEIIEKQRSHSLYRNQLASKKYHQVLIEGYSKRSTEYLQGRNSEGKVIVFPKKKYQIGEYVEVYVEECTSATLIGEAQAPTMMMQESL